MEIIETYINSKSGKVELSEDEIFISNDFVAVIDGATSKGKFSFEDKTSGKVAAEVLKSALTNMPRDITGVKAIEFLSNYLSLFYKEQGIYDFLCENRHETPTAAIIIYSVALKELWLVGDCQAIIDGVTYTNEKPIDLLVSEMRSMFIETELMKGATIEDLQEKDTGREFILPLLKRQYLFQNSKSQSKYVYEAIDGFKINEKGIKIHKLNNPKEIILSSDGYPKLFETLEKSEEYLEYVLKSDPLAYKIHKSTKGIVKGNISFDDRSYVRVRG
ncbi:MAG: hypothetical protein BWY78_01261 [Alphaproteobacteria bacterium ADurb.Bin438]|nr:MAG: hypothetical protein BWY78_01261 [Alphaproteobacteria bacterium ADurb.Bin438]